MACMAPRARATIAEEEDDMRLFAATSSGPLRTGALWATASGQSGQVMQMVFTLNVP